MNEKRFIILVALCCTIFFSSCNTDEPFEEEEKGTFTETTACEAVTIDAKFNFGSTATYQWSVESTPSVDATIYSLTNATAEKVTFIAATSGTYQLKLTAISDEESHMQDVTVLVKEPSSALSPYISKVYDFFPAPGQFTNKMPNYTEGDTKENIVAKAAERIVGKKQGILISLGGFGGYITFGFDHTVVNVAGRRDIRVMGNYFSGSAETGIIMVAYDTNKNGVPDDNEWYEIAGSEYHKPTTIKNYEITYFRPVSEEPSQVEGQESFMTIKDYIRWEDNQGGSGYKYKNSYHRQTYYPSWITEDKITFKGTLLPNNRVFESIWTLTAYGYGYADNALNAGVDSAIDIGWAVDSDGNKVELPGIDFMKVYTGLNQEAGVIGETSTEISGAYDLHLLGEEINSI